MRDENRGRGAAQEDQAEYEIDADAEGLSEADIVEATTEAVDAVEEAARRAQREEQLRAELEAARAELEAVRGELESSRDLYLRKLAEFDNFRRRTEREREELIRTAGEAVVRELVPVLDNFHRALQHRDDVDPAAFRLGVEMIARQLRESLNRQGLEVISPLGEAFNPEVHEAVQRVENTNAEPGTVVDVLGHGYLFGGRLVRPALVAVAVDPGAGESGEGGEAP